MENNDFNISIIIPVYNSQKYLLELLESLKSQDYLDFEVIIIDDGSNDDSFLICSKFEMENKNIRIFKQKNRGVSQTRNFGLSKANGKYVMFLDSDDYLSNNILKTVAKYLENEEPDILNFNFHIIKGNQSYLHLLDDFYEKGKKLSRDESVKSLLSSKGYQGFVWNKIYKKEVIEEILFDKSIHYLEDTIFNVQAIYNSKKIICLRDPLVYYRQHNDSAVATFNSKQLTYISALNMLQSQLSDEFSNEIKTKKLLSYITFGSNAFFKDKDLFKKMERQFKLEKNKTVFKEQELKSIEKILLYTGYYNFKLSIVLYFLKRKIVSSNLYFWVRK